MKNILILLVVFFTGAQAEQNEVIVGNGFIQNQNSIQQLTFNLPDNCTEDLKSAKEHGLYSVIVPKGKTLLDTDEAITIAFQKKSNSEKTLKEFFKVDMMHFLNRFENAQAAKWQPSSLNPNKINFMSIETYGQQTPISRVLYIESTDGYYTISLTTTIRQALNKREYRNFFNSIKLR